MAAAAAAAAMTVRDLTLKLKRSGVMPRIPINLIPLDNPLVTFIRTSRRQLLTLQQLCGNVVVICKQTKRRRVARILFDGRHVQLNSKNQSILYVILNNDGVCLRTYKGDLMGYRNERRQRCIPKKILLSTNVKPLDLHTLLSSLLPTYFVSITSSPPLLPSNRDETLSWLRFYKIIQYVVIRWCYYIHTSGRPEAVEWICIKDLDHEELYSIDANQQIIQLDAFTRPDGTLSFREIYKRPNLFKQEKRKQRERITDHEEQQQLSLPAPQKPAPPPLYNNDNNRSASYSIKLTGLSHAYRLGAIKCKSTLVYLSQQMAQHIPRVWFHLDSANNICHAACYITGGGNNDEYKSFEIQQPDNDKFASWNLFFDHVYAQCAQLCIWRATLLKDVVLNLVEDEDVRRGTRFKCRQSLLQAIKTITIHTYAGNDKVMHALKIAFAHYWYSTKGNRSNIQVESNVLHGIVCLVARDIRIENIAPLLLIAPQKAQDPDNALWELARQWTMTTDQQPAPPPPLRNPNVSAKRYRKNMSENTIPYSPFTPKSMDIYIERRAIQYLDLLKVTFCAVATYLCEAYCFDITSIQFTSIASIAIKCVQLSFYEKGGPMSQSIEMTKIQYAHNIRLHTRGGFSYSIRDTIICGQSLYNNNNTDVAAAVAEYDVTSCYGYSACNMRAPAGFCIGYTKSPDNQLLLRTDNVNRANTFEYRACMYYLHIRSKSLPNIRSVYSNYSPLGLFYIGKYPIDLVIVLDNETNDTLIIQFDGQFAHGCSECPPLKRYVNDASLSDVMERTNTRNKVTNDWIASATTSTQRFIYRIYTDCHDDEFIPSWLSNAFAHVPELRKYTEPYRQLPKPGMVMTADHILNAHPDLTYLLVGTGYIPTEKRRGGGSGPLFIWTQSDNGKWRQDFGWEVITPILFTRDTLEYATNNYGFQLTNIESCYFYKTCDIYPLVYKDLITERYKTTYPAVATFIKTIVNYSVGMMGYNPAKNKTYGKPTICTKLTKYNNNNIRSICTVAGTYNNTTYFLRQMYRSQKHINASNNRILNNALPVFASIVEYGKLRMQEVAAFWHKHTIPGSIRICYSQIDNFIVAMSTHSLDEAIDPTLMAAYLQQKPHFIGNLPGQLKLVWNVSSSNWRFTSPSTCNYACDEHWRLNAITGVDSASEAHNILQQLVHRQSVYLTQTRRTNKLHNTHTKSSIYHFKPI